MISNGRVSLQGIFHRHCGWHPSLRYSIKTPLVQNYFESQPHNIVNNVTLFYLRFIIHDCDAANSIKILTQLHAAASPTTKLLLVDQLVPYACPVPASWKVAGLQPLEAPAPLLANLGPVNSDVYLTDFTMAALLNSQERTLDEIKDILGLSGWKLDRVYQTVGSNLTQFVCTKIWYQTAMRLG